MRFEVGGHIEDHRSAGAVVHGTVVDAIAVNGRTDAEVVDVRGENDIFVFEGGIGAGKPGDDVGGRDWFGDDGGSGLKRSVEREVRHRLAVFGESSDFGEGVIRTGEEQFRGGRIEGDADVEASSFVEFGIGEVHGGLVAVEGDAGPGNVHGGGIENGAVTHGSG